MGFAAAFLAFKNNSPEHVHQLLGLKPTGKAEGFPQSPVSAAMLPTQWYVVVFQRTEFKDHQLAKFSAGCELCYGFVEEHVMFSAASLWSDGRPVWSVLHDSEQGPEHLRCEGALPGSFEKIRQEQFALQRRQPDGEPEVDYIFDIPVELTRRLLGFSVSHGVEGNVECPFAVFERERRKRTGLFSLFSK